MYRIGDFSKMTKQTVKTIRYYDEMGLLRPAWTDQETGYRYYTTEQLLPLHRIVSLRQAGLSIEEVRCILSGQDAQEILLARRAGLVSERDAIQGQLSHLNSILQHYKEDLSMEYQAIRKELPACTVYYKQGVIAGFEKLTDFILGSAEECRAANPDIQCLDPDYCYISYLDPEFKQTDIRIEYAQAVTKAGRETESIRFKKLPGTPAICVYHKGPFSELGKAYAFILGWMKENNYKQAASPREQYIDGMWNKDDPADYLTEIQIPIE